MLKFILTIILIVSNFIVFGANIHGIVSDKNGVPVQGVNVRWLHTNIGAVTDQNGHFEIAFTKANDKLIFSNVAFKNDTIVVSDETKHISLHLNDEIQLQDIQVVSKRSANMKFKTTIIQTEKLNKEELLKAACCNLSESFTTNPSVDVAYSDAATGAKQIKLLGLSGNYVQMLTENIPNLRGISSVYGLGYIPGPWMESISISKGTGSVINGYESIAGQINVEYKKPNKNEIVAFNLYGSDAGRMEANADASVKLNPYLSTGVFLHASDELETLDENNDGYMDMPMVKQYNFINRWFYNKKGYTSQAFVKALSEERMGGLTNHNYMVDINTKRYEFFLKNGYVYNPLKAGSFGLIISGSVHDQQAMYGHRNYNGIQGNLYMNFILQQDIDEKQKISTGVSFNYDNYNEELVNGNTQKYDSKEYIPGIFAEYVYHPNEQLNFLVGFRSDYHNQFGLFVTPRLHVRYAPIEQFHFRATLGKGYRSPKILAENNYYLASNRQFLVDSDLKMEDAWNYGMSVHTGIPIGNKEISLMGEWFYTNFNNQIINDVDSDPHQVHFYNSTGKSYSSSVQFEANTELFRGLSLTLAHRLNDVKMTIKGNLREKPLSSRFKSLFTASYQTPLKKWQFDFTTQINGGGRLPDADKLNPLWAETFEPFTLINTQITKYFRSWSVYLGAENLTNFVQENPVIDFAKPHGQNFDATVVWGPTHGRKIYAGFRWSLEKNK